jgi:general secretion pathway protein D
MTPRVVRDQREARLVTEEFREKLKNASSLVENEMKREDGVGVKAMGVSEKKRPGNK